MTPAFAVVGHPNKGKSSIVATLAQDDSISISTESGTTRLSQSIEIKVGDSHYRLIDTPGFQRPTRTLQWLQQQASSADQRQDAVRKFINDESCQQNFPDEVQLLTPIVNGAAILYVADGSRPYGPEYEAEMEILRWTGQASMALINPIENEDHIEPWTQALGQYFKVVRVFNAMQAEFDKQLSMLEALSHIKQEWHDSIEQLISAYATIRSNQQQESLRLLAELLTTVCSHRVSQNVLNKGQALALQPILEKRYLSDMKGFESRFHDKLKDLYRYHNLHSDIVALPLDDNLFDTEKWIVWGLNRSQLTLASGMAGAVTGAAVDLSLAGSSFMLGAIGGAVVAGSSAWLGANRLAEFKIKGLPIGGYEARQGPIRNKNFPYVVLGRYLFLHQSLGSRTHARRDSLQIEAGELSQRIKQLPSNQQSALHKSLNRLSQQKPVDDLLSALEPLLNPQSSASA